MFALFKDSPQPLKKALLKANMNLLIMIITAMVISQILQLVAPEMMRLILEFLSTDDEPSAKIYTYAVMITLAFFLRTMIAQQGLHFQNVLAFRVQG